MRKILIICCLTIACCSMVWAKGATRGIAPVNDKASEIAAMEAEKGATDVTRSPDRNIGLDEGGEGCTTATDIPGLPYTDSGNTCDNVDDTDEVCPYEGSTSPDVAYHYAPDTDYIEATLSLCSGTTNYDTKLYVYDITAGMALIACNDDACSSPLFANYVSRLNCVGFEGGHEYCIIVDGYGGDCGDYTLTIEECEVFQCDCGGEWCDNEGGFIADGVTLTRTVDVDVEYHITDVNLCLDLEHTYLGDLFITLTSPLGTEVIIWSNQCNGNDNMPCVHFDDDAGGFLSCPPAEGQTGWAWGFLSDFNGENAYGTWTLNITDCCGGDTGPLNFWCLSFGYDEILPVTFGSFSALVGDNSVALSWNTESESSMDRFEIVRDGATIGEVTAMNSATGSNYTWVDNNANNGTTYNYTLVSVDNRGAREELATVSATPNFSNGAVTEYALMQNYPNPFNPETNISFDLVESGIVTLSVYNMLGQQVATLVNGSMEAGRHVVSFNAANLSSGLYLYRLEAGDFSAQMKMVLMK